MSKFSVKDIQFMNRDLCNGYPKEQAYLWFVGNADRCPGAPYQLIFKRYPLMDQDRDDIIKCVYDAYRSAVTVSGRCKYLVFIKEFCEMYSGYECHPLISKMNCLPDYTVETSPISNRYDMDINCITIWEMNHISPPLTGLFYENMLNYIIMDIAYDRVVNKQNIFKAPSEHRQDQEVFNRLRYNISCEGSRLCTSLYGSKLNVGIDSIISLLTRNFLKIPGKFSVIYEDHCLWLNILEAPNISPYSGYIKECHFKNKYYFLLWLSFLHTLKNQCDPAVVEDVLKLRDYIDVNITEIDRYYNELKHSTIVKRLVGRYDLTSICHGVTFKTANVRGEVDFITPNEIVDIKCYRNDEKDIWAAQLYQYILLSRDSVYVDDAGKEQKRNILGGMIINMFSNEVHSYKFSWMGDGEDEVQSGVVNRDVEFGIDDEDVTVMRKDVMDVSSAVEQSDEDSDDIKPIE